MRTLFLAAIATGIAFLLLRSWSPELFRRKGRVAFFGSGALVVVAWAVARMLGDAAGVLSPIAKALAGIWSVTMLICIAIAGPLVLARWIVARVKRASPVPAPVDESRRRFLGGLVVPMAAASTSAGGTLAGLQPFQVRHEEIRIRGLPREFDGFRIGQLTDVHVGDFIDVDYLQRAVDALDAEGVDLQVQTGDLIDDMTQLDGTMAALDSVKAKHGMVCIIGNHEIWRGRDETYEAYARIAPNGRVKFLVDGNLMLEHKGAKLRVVGVDYPMNGTRGHRLPKPERLAKMNQSADKAFEGCSPDELVLCLSHHPDFFPIAAERGAKLQLSGHTHGGQVGFMRVPLFGFAFEHMLGKYQRGDAHLYVSGGTGHWMPFRVGVPTEVTVLTLRAA